MLFTDDELRFLRWHGLDQDDVCERDFGAVPEECSVLYDGRQ